MKFESKKIDMTLELEGNDNTVKVFYPKEPPSADVANKVRKEISLYQESQKTIPEELKDAVHEFNLKALSWIYADFDKEWTSRNFTASEINAMGTWVNEQLLGLGKEKGN